MQKIPEKADDLIDELDRAFALRNLPPDMPYHEMQRELGKRDVIDFLRALQTERAEQVAKEFGGKGNAEEVGQWSTR